MSDFDIDVVVKDELQEVSAGAVVLPRLVILNTKSKYCTKSTPATYVEGAEEGLFLNSATTEVYGDTVRAIPLYYTQGYTIWEGDAGKTGAAYRGTLAPSHDAVRAALLKNDRVGYAYNVGDGQFIKENLVYYIALITPDGELLPMSLSLSGSRMKAAQSWWAVVDGIGKASYTRIYDLTTVVDANGNYTFKATLASKLTSQEQADAVLALVPKAVEQAALDCAGAETPALPELAGEM
jgi:hypothetical protein